MSSNILGELEKFLQESANKRQSFLISITKSSKAISEGANKWYCSEVDLLQKEMDILKRVMPSDASEWNIQLVRIEKRFHTALSFLNKIIERAEKGNISLSEVNPPKPELETYQPIDLFKKNEEKELNLVSAMLEVFDSASDLEKLIKDVEKESSRTIYTAKLVMQAIK